MIFGFRHCLPIAAYGAGEVVKSLVVLFNCKKVLFCCLLFIHSFIGDLLTEQVYDSLFIVLQTLLSSAAFFRSA